MDLQLTGKVAFVTGGSKGIGRAVAQELAQEGCDVVITARTQEPLEVAAREIAAMTNRKVVPLDGDMSKHPDVQRCVGAALEQFGRIDILVTCAGSSPGGLLEDLTEEQWMPSLNLKFMGYVRTVRAVIPHMRERGDDQRRAHPHRRCSAQGADGRMKAKLLGLIEIGRQKEAEVFVPRVDDSAPAAPGRWTAKDTAAHLLSWRQVAAGELDSVRTG